MEQSLALINSGTVNSGRITTHRVPYTRAPKTLPLHDHPTQTLGLLHRALYRTPLALEDASALTPSPGGEGWGEGSSGQPRPGHARVSSIETSTKPGARPSHAAARPPFVSRRRDPTVPWRVPRFPANRRKPRLTVGPSTARCLQSLNCHLFSPSVHYPQTFKQPFPENPSCPPRQPESHAPAQAIPAHLGSGEFGPRGASRVFWKRDYPLVASREDSRIWAAFTNSR